MSKIAATHFSPNGPQNMLLNGIGNIDLIFKNNSTDISQLGFGGGSDLLVQNGLDINCNPDYGIPKLVGTGSWIINSSGEGKWIWTDTNNNIIKYHPFDKTKTSNILTIPSNPNITVNNVGWKWYTIESPYSSYGSSQPEFILSQLYVEPNLQSGASPNIPLYLLSRPFFRYGLDVLDNPDVDLPIVGDITSTYIIPEVVIITKHHDKPENETVSGPNFPITFSINVYVANNIQISNLEITENISNFMLLYDPDISNQNSVIGDITFTNSSILPYLQTFTIVDSRGNPINPQNNSGITHQRILYYFNILNGLGTESPIISFSYKTYVPYCDINSYLILDQSSFSIKRNGEYDSYNNYITDEYTVGTYTYNTSNCITLSNEAILIIKQLCIQKNVEGVNSKTIIPLTILKYTLHVQLSDFFVLDQVTINDLLTDGHYLSESQQTFGYSGNFTLTCNNNVYKFTSSDIVITDNINSIYNSGSSILPNRYNILFNLNNSINIIDKSTDTKIKGGYTGLSNSGPLIFTITYYTTVDQLYYSKTNSISNLDGNLNKLEIGDYIKSNVEIFGINYNWNTNESYNNKISDGSNTVTKIGSISIIKTIYYICDNLGNKLYTNDTDIPSSLSLHIKATDTIVYRIIMKLSHQNFHNFTISDYLPPPIIKAQNMTFNYSINNSKIGPSLNTIQYGLLHTLEVNPSVNPANTLSNSFDIVYGDYQIPFDSTYTTRSIGERIIDILYTVSATSVPTVDQLSMTNQAYFSTTSIMGVISTGFEYTGIILDQPVLNIQKSVISFNSSLKYTSLVPSLPDLPGNNIKMIIPFNLNPTLDFSQQSYIDGSVIINSNVVGLNRGDYVNYAIVLCNSGNSDAYNVHINTDNTWGNNGSISQLDTITIFDGYGKKLNIDNSGFTLGTPINIGNIPGTNSTTSPPPPSSVRIILYTAKIKSLIDEIINNEIITDNASIYSYYNTSNITDLIYNFCNIPIYSQCNLSLRNVTISKNITFRSENPSDISNRIIDESTIGEIVRIVSNVIIPTGTLYSCIFKDLLNTLLNNQVNSGWKLINTDINLNNISFIPENSINNTTDISQIIINQQNTDPFIYYNFGQILNNSSSSIVLDGIITITQYLMASNEKYNGKYLLGESGISDAYNNSSSSNITLNSHTVNITSNNIIINIKEPKILITKNFYDPINKTVITPSGQTFESGDKLTYRIKLTNSSTVNPHNVVFTDDVPISSHTVNDAYLLNNLTLNPESPFSESTNYISYNFTNFTETAYLCINSILNQIMTGDKITNIAIVSYNSIDTTMNYSGPFLITSISQSTNSRQYTSLSSVSLIVYPYITHLQNNITFTHNPYITNSPTLVYGAIGDNINITVNIDIPKGTTFLDKVIIKFTNIDNIIPNLSDITVSLPYLLQDGTGLSTNTNTNTNTFTITNIYINGNYIIFPISRLFLNNSSTNDYKATISFINIYQIKNTLQNIAGYSQNILSQFNIKNSDNSVVGPYFTSSQLSCYTIEPKITTTVSLIEIPLRQNDTFTFKVNMVANSGDFYTVPFNPNFSFTIPNDIIDSSSTNIIAPSDIWKINTVVNELNTIYTVYSTNNLPMLTFGNTKNIDFNITLKLKSSINGVYTQAINTLWSSQALISQLNIPSNYNLNSIRLGINNTLSNSINNYIQNKNIDIHMHSAIESIKFGICFEDALDFDYDYEDAVFNIEYLIYKNKLGIKRLIADIHLVTRGSSFDHAFGLSISNLLINSSGFKRIGTWNVGQYCGNTNTYINNNDNILTYLKKTGYPNTLYSLDENCIPIIISTIGLLPHDLAKVGYTFGANSSNRTELIPNWVEPSTSRFVLDFANGSEILTSPSQYFLPYIDVITNKHSLTKEYRKILGGCVDVSFKHFTFNNVDMTYTHFPHAIITPIDFITTQDFGETSNNLCGIKDTYNNFINYVTNGLYPSTNNMIDMTKIVDRLNDAKLSNSWTNTNVIKNNLIKKLATDYDNLIIQDKEYFEQYKTRNIFYMNSDKYQQSFSKIFSPLSVVTNYTILSSQSFLKLDITHCSTESIYNICESNESNIKYTGSNVSINTSEIFSNSNILKTAISPPDQITKNSHIAYIKSDYNIYTTDTSHDVFLHGDGGRQVYDLCYIGNSDIISIGKIKSTDSTLTKISNTLVHTSISSSNINLSNIIDPIKIVSSDNYIGCLTSDNLVYLIDMNGNQTLIFKHSSINISVDSSDVIVDININSINILGLSSFGNIFVYPLNNRPDPNLYITPIITNVIKYDSNGLWGVFLTGDGLIIMKEITGNCPNITNTNGIVAYTDETTTYIDVYCVNSSILAVYI